MGEGAWQFLCCTHVCKCTPPCGGAGGMHSCLGLPRSITAATGMTLHTHREDWGDSLSQPSQPITRGMNTAPGPLVPAPGPLASKPSCPKLQPSPTSAFCHWHPPAMASQAQEVSCAAAVQEWGRAAGGSPNCPWSSASPLGPGFGAGWARVRYCLGLFWASPLLLCLCSRALGPWVGSQLDRARLPQQMHTHQELH